METYIVTGGSLGIGAAVVKRLREQGHRVITISLDNSDINVDLGTAQGRQFAIDRVHEFCPDGIDGLVSNAGIASAPRLSTVLSVNYFGAVAIMEGLFDLLQKKQGRICCVTSASTAYGGMDSNKYQVDKLLVNCGDEERIGALVDTFDPKKVDGTVYGSTKCALVRWVRRTAPSWGMKGVALNALAPGAVATTIMDGIKDMGCSDEVKYSYPLPVLYGQECILPPDYIAESILYLISKDTHGMCGSVTYCDGGCEAALHSEKYY